MALCSITPMFSLQRLLGKEDKFFTLLEASAQEARTSVQALVKLSKDFDQPAVLDEFAHSRRKDKQITKDISNAVYTTFVTAIEREDIEDLSNALYKIPKTVDKFSERLLLAPQHVRLVVEEAEGDRVGGLINPRHRFNPYPCRRTR